ncbi:MAG: DUF2815 family protein [Clostridiales bacterium]|nr:DUF2815 family protein [Candidatus Apopatocola equi]
MIATKVVTGERTRWSYVHVLEPQSINGSKPKYSVCLLIPKEDQATVDAIREAIRFAYTAGKAKLQGNSKSVPPLETIKTPLRDGDVEHPGELPYANCFFLNANNTIRPQVVDSECRPIMNQEDVYSGCYGRASISFYAFNVNGNRGIACGLNSLQKLSDGDRLGGGPSSAALDFGDMISDPLLL